MSLPVTYAICYVSLFASVLRAVNAVNVERLPTKFPKGFSFGVGTAAYQIEGGWNASDKSESIWDRLMHDHSNVVSDGTNGDVACDSYNLYKRDVDMLEELGVDFYRFSISWPRLLPKGFGSKVSVDGLRYYNALIDELLSRGIQPVVTLYHYDLPQSLQDLGGWVNPIIADYFEDYADVAFSHFGDRVKTWLTFNEPQVACELGYGDPSRAPMVNAPGIGNYLCGHTVLRAHAKAYHLYDRVYRDKQKGRVSLTLIAFFRQPASDSEEDKNAAERKIQFELGWFAHPIFSEQGDYPSIMKSAVAAASLRQGFRRSRLPEFTDEDLEAVRGSYDFFGLNHYTTSYAAAVRSNATDDDGDVSFANDANSTIYYDPKWPQSQSSWLKVVPWGFRKILNWIKDNYNNTEVIIFECGFSDNGVIDDTDRISYFREYLKNMLAAIQDGCNVTAFTAWSLMDNLEWTEGYKKRFGLYYVHFDTPDKKREPKSSAKYYQQVIKSRTVL